MSEMNGHVRQRWRERLLCGLALSAVLALALALPACSKEAEETKTVGEPKVLHAFLPVSEKDALKARAEFARRTFLLGKGEKERQQAYEIFKLLDPEEAWILEVSTAEEMVEERAIAAAEAAQRRFFLAETDRERQRALEELKRLDPEEAQELKNLGPGEVVDWGKEVGMEEARLQFQAAKTDEERERAYQEIKRLDPEAATEAFLEEPEEEKEGPPKEEKESPPK